MYTRFWLAAITLQSFVGLTVAYFLLVKVVLVGFTQNLWQILIYDDDNLLTSHQKFCGTYSFIGLTVAFNFIRPVVNSGIYPVSVAHILSR